MTPEIQRLALKVSAANDRQEYLQARSEFIKAMADHERLYLKSLQDD